MMRAARSGHIECIKVLAVQPAIMLNKRGSTLGESPLYLAAKYGHIEAVKLFCSLPDIAVNEADSAGRTPHGDACWAYAGPDKDARTATIREILEGTRARCAL